MRSADGETGAETPGPTLWAHDNQWSRRFDFKGALLAPRESGVHPTNGRGGYQRSTADRYLLETDFDGNIEAQYTLRSGRRCCAHAEVDDQHPEIGGVHGPVVVHVGEIVVTAELINEDDKVLDPDDRVAVQITGDAG